MQTQLLSWDAFRAVVRRLQCCGAHAERPSWEEQTGLSDSQITAFRRDLKALADKIDRVNKVFAIGPANYFTVALECGTISEEEEPDFLTRKTIFLGLPNVLRMYEAYLSSFSSLMRQEFGPKRLDFLRFLTIQLVAYVERCTGKPHYEDLTCLLQGG